MSNIFISWHMIIRGHIDETIKCIDSLQGLYDECIIAVDDREDSNEVYEYLQHYPNMNAYRQNFDHFGRYDLARQDALNRVNPNADYIGWCDSDEVLVSPERPLQIRSWLAMTQPDAVNVGLHYLGDIGGHVAGQTYYRTRIWKKSAERRWTRPCHEHPFPVNGIDEPVINQNIVFNHIKLDNSEYRASHHIELMQKEIDQGLLGWMFFQAREFKFLGKQDKARETYKSYLKSGDTSELDRTLEELREITSREEYISDLLEAAEATNNCIIWEYLAINEYYNNQLNEAYTHHKIAKSLDPDQLYQFIITNDLWLDKELVS